jgi:hypothetical protein
MPGYGINFIPGDNGLQGFAAIGTPGTVNLFHDIHINPMNNWIDPDRRFVNKFQKGSELPVFFLIFESIAPDFFQICYQHVAYSIHLENY